MKEALRLTSASLTDQPNKPHPPKRGRIALVFVLVWTVLAGLALWWLLRADPGPSIVILREGNSPQPIVSERFHAWFKADLGLQRIYPWALFGPYVGLIAWWFPLERGRLRLNGPLNLAACSVFLAASHALNARISHSVGKLVIVNSQHQTSTPGKGIATNTTYIKVIKSESPEVFEEQIAKTLPPPADVLLDGPIQHFQYVTSLGWSNMTPEGQFPLKPPQGWPGPPRFSLLSWVLDLLAYSAITGLAHSVHFYRRFREREHRALVLESSLSSARLNALRAQLQPHFLFISLNAIATLLRRDPRQARTGTASSHL